MKNVKLLVLSLLFYATTGSSREKDNRFKVPDLQNSHIITGESSQDIFDSQQVRVLVWNILKAKRENWSTDFLKLTAKSDLLLLQEGYLNDLTQETFRSLTGYRIDFGISFLYLKNHGFPTGTALGSRVTPAASYILRTNDFEPFIATPKTITYGYYPITNSSEKILIINIHALNFTKQEAFERQLIGIFNIIEKHKGPIIFGGDFNTRTKNRMVILRQMMAQHHLTEVAFQDDDRMTFMGNTLDHVFIRNFKVKEARVLPMIESSDHKPIYLDLMLDY